MLGALAPLVAGGRDATMRITVAADHAIHRRDRFFARWRRCDAAGSKRKGQNSDEHQTERGLHVWCLPVKSQRTGMPGSAPLSASSNASAPPSKPAERIMPSLTPKRIFRGARLAMKTTLRPTSVSGWP